MWRASALWGGQSPVHHSITGLVCSPVGAGASLPPLALPWVASCPAVIFDGNPDLTAVALATVRSFAAVCLAAVALPAIVRSAGGQRGATAVGAAPDPAALRGPPLLAAAPFLNHGKLYPAAFALPPLISCAAVYGPPLSGPALVHSPIGHSRSPVGRGSALSHRRWASKTCSN